MAHMLSELATGAQLENTLHVVTDTDEFLIKGRPCELSAFAYVPPTRDPTKERNAFNSERTERYSHSTYDRLYHMPLDYNNKLHRCDRDHAKSKGLVVNDEEKIKIVPTLASSEYGHRLVDELDPPNRKHVRVGLVQSEFYRRNGINVRETNKLQDL